MGPVCPLPGAVFGSLVYSADFVLGLGRATGVVDFGSAVFHGLVVG